MKYLSLLIQNPNPGGPSISVTGPPGVETTGNILTNLPQFIVTVAFLIAIVLAIVFIIISGIQWIISGGDAKKIEGARNRLVYSIVGLIVVFLSFIIIGFIYKVLGIQDKIFNIPR